MNWRIKFGYSIFIYLLKLNNAQSKQYNPKMARQQNTITL